MLPQLQTTPPALVFLLGDPNLPLRVILLSNSPGLCLPHHDPSQLLLARACTANNPLQVVKQRNRLVRSQLRTIGTFTRRNLLTGHPEQVAQGQAVQVAEVTTPAAQTAADRRQPVTLTGEGEEVVTHLTRASFRHLLHLRTLDLKMQSCGSQVVNMKNAF